MIRAIKHALAGLAAGLAIQPTSRAAAPPESRVQDEAQKLDKSLADYTASNHDLRYLYANYTGLSTPLDQQLLGVGKWRNTAISRTSAQKELEGFIQARMR